MLEPVKPVATGLAEKAVSKPLATDRNGVQAATCFGLSFPCSLLYQDSDRRQCGRFSNGPL